MMITTPSFGSPFATELAEFLESRWARGYRYGERQVHRLASFDRFVSKALRTGQAASLATLVPAWLARFPYKRKTSTVRSDLGVVRQFCLYRRQRGDAATYVPDGMLVPPRDVGRFLPHIFTVGEVRRALEAARVLKPSFRGETFRVVLLVLYCTGLRFGEPFRLKLQHLDLRARTFYVEHSKGRSRWVPFDSSLAREIRRYLQSRDAVSARSPSSPLFLQPTGRPYSTKTASDIVRHVLRRAGLKPARGRAGPRPYDFRPTFAVHRLTRWYESGVVLEDRLAWLSAYMGHDNLLGTQVYLRATAQLLQYASDRFARHFWHARCDT